MHLKNLVSTGQEDETDMQYEEPVYEIDDPGEAAAEDLLGPGVLKRLAAADDDEETAAAGDPPGETAAF